MPHLPDLNDDLATLKTLRAIAQRYICDLNRELDEPDEHQAPVRREKSVQSLRTLLKTIEEIAELEERFKRAGDASSAKEVDSKQRRDLARRIQALQRQD